MRSSANYKRFFRTVLAGFGKIGSFWIFLELNLIVLALFIHSGKIGSSRGGGGTPILGHIRNVRPEWVSFPGRKPADGCKFLT